MKKAIVVMLCLASLSLQGCWTTMTKKNPQYADCSSYHNRSSAGGQQAHYVTVVSASAGRCYGAGGDSLANARKAAVSICKSNGHQDCAVYAENKKIVLSPTMKDRDMDWDSTFTLLTLGMAGAVAYEAGKGGTAVNSPYVRQVSSASSYPIASSAGTLPSPIPSNTVPSAGSQQNGASSYSSATSALSGRQETRIPNVKNCVKYQNIKRVAGTDTTMWYRLTNVCNQTIDVHWCDSTGADYCQNLQYSTTLSPGRFDESWFDGAKYKGIAYFACPDTYQGKLVNRRSVSGGDFYCYISN